MAPDTPSSDYSKDRNFVPTTNSPRTVTEILAEREKTHGKFSNHALLAQGFKKLAGEYGVSELSPSQAEALEMIFHKIARILNGNPNHKDHWDDLGGYAELVSREL